MKNILNNKIKILLLLAVAIIVGAASYLSFLSIAQNSLLVSSHARWIADFSDNRNLIGVADNVFAVKIVEKVGQVEDPKTLPKTLFIGEVVYNIKGELEGLVDVVQPIGYITNNIGLKALHSLDENARFLEVGQTYLVATRSKHNEKTKRYYISSYPTATQLLSGDKTFTREALQSVANQDETVQAWKEAYRNEILDPFEVKAGTAPNSYQSLSEEQKEIIDSEINQFQESQKVIKNIF